MESVHLDGTTYGTMICMSWNGLGRIIDMFNTHIIEVDRAGPLLALSTTRTARSQTDKQQASDTPLAPPQCKQGSDWSLTIRSVRR